MTYRFPPIVGAVAGFAFAALALWAEAIIFLEYRSADLAVASTGVLTTLSPNGECVGYAPPEDVEARYTGKTGQLRIFGLSALSFGGQEVACDLEDADEKLAALVLGSVHALRYAWTKGTLGATAASSVATGYAAAAAAALGSDVEINWDDALAALQALPEPPTNCSSIYPGAALAAAPAAGTLRVDCQAVAHPSLPDASSDGALFTHCVEQFQIGRFAPDLDSYTLGWISGLGGTLGLPVHGQLLKPAFSWYAPGRLNETMPWDERSRILAGMRFNWSLVSSTLGVMVAAFLLFDCLFVLLVEMTLNARTSAAAFTTPQSLNKRDMVLGIILKMYATSNAMRTLRFFMGVFGWLLLAIARILFEWAPWGFGALMPRPECKAGEGWMEDGSFALGYLSLWLLLCCTLVVPASKSRLFSIDYLSAYRGPLGGDDPPVTDLIPGARRTRTFLALALLGAAVCIGVQIFVTNIFFDSWARAIADPAPGDTWDPDKYVEVVFYKALGAVGIAVSAGIAFAAIMARWLFSGRSFCACLTLLIWLLCATIALLPLLLVEGFSFSQDQFNADCEVLEGSDRTACESRFYVYLVGIAAVFAPLAGMVLYCALRMSCTVCIARNASRANVGPEGRNVVRQAGGVGLRDGVSTGTDPAAHPLLNIRV